MARSKNNPVIQGLSGQFGGSVVFRQRGGKTFVSKFPQMPDGPPTPVQQATRSRFQQAIAYGRAAIADPAVKAAYAAAATDGQTAFNVAVADFYHAPVIHAVYLTEYTGLPGSILAIEATDDFAVAAVAVRIEALDGSLVEEGPAAAQPSAGRYLYTVTAQSPAFGGSRIIVTVADRPGNSATHISTL